MQNIKKDLVRVVGVLNQAKKEVTEENSRATINIARLQEKEEKRNRATDDYALTGSKAVVALKEIEKAAEKLTMTQLVSSQFSKYLFISHAQLAKILHGWSKCYQLNDNINCGAKSGHRGVVKLTHRKKF